MKISSINNIKLNYSNKTVNSTQSNINKNIDLKELYPFICTNYISFGAKARTNQEKLDFIGENNFPNQEILDSFKQVIDNNEDKKLYEIHEEYYADLLECKTLNEAKKRNVFGTKMRSVIYAANKEGIEKIVNQQFEFAKIIIAPTLFLDML